MNTIQKLAVVIVLMTGVQAFSQNGNQYLGQIMWAPYANTPRNWAECNGQLLSINQNQALFSLLGTSFGGNGVTTFALPDMRGRTPMDDLPLSVGTKVGVSSVTLTTQQIPAHNHFVTAVKAVGNSSSPIGNRFADTAQGDPEYANTTFDSSMGTTILAATGGSQPHNNMQPYVVLKCFIALTGIYPTRN